MSPLVKHFKFELTRILDTPAFGEVRILDFAKQSHP